MWRLLMRLGIRRGLLGGSRPWVIVLGVVGARRLLQIVAGSVKEVVYSGELRPGEQLVITHRPVTHGELAREEMGAGPR